MGIEEIIARLGLSDLQVEDPEGLYQHGNYRVSESLGYLLKRTVSNLSTALDQELARYDLTHQQFSILRLLAEHNCATAADLAREHCADTGAMTRMIDRLEAKDIVRRTRSAEDRRVVNIELTEVGQVLIDRLPILAINVLNRYLKGFSVEELEQMKSFLRRILENAGAALPAPPNPESTPE